MNVGVRVDRKLGHATIVCLVVGVGLVKSPFLALAIGLIACGQGLLTEGGAVAVGSRTTSAVVQSIFCVVVISTLFTFFFALLGI